MTLQRVKELVKKSGKTLKDEGLKSLVMKSSKFIGYRINKINSKYDYGFKDVLFINGCSLQHPQRYRVTHQIEQLESYGVSCDKIDYDKLNLDIVRFYRAFVIYRCPITPVVEEFVKLAKENNKTLFYDIDDLVFDLKYTKDIKYLDTISESERNLYNDGVVRMGKTLDLCDYGIASTDRLQTEMSKHLKEVYINRNVASEEMVKYSEEALVSVNKDNSKIVMGYLSGTITHNDDFKLIMPTIIEILKKYDNVYLQIVGLLDLPEEMKAVAHKVITAPFTDWKNLPKLIRSIDINLAPLENNIFNEAKSENKWTEAALVKIPTIASNVGAFKSQIIDGKTGLLCNELQEWESKLIKLIEDESYRLELGENSYNEIMKNHITITSGRGVADFILSKLKKNICFVLPSTNISGGVLVVIKHGIILKKYGYDVTIINVDHGTRKVSRVNDGNDYLYVVPEKRVEYLSRIDNLVATMWLTLDFVKKYPNCINRKYLVQGMETGLYKTNEFQKRKANSTYYNQVGIEYLTISKWCKKWLENDFEQKVKYVPNGIDLSLFKEKNRKFNNKIQILIEGNCDDHYKNVDESFKIVEKLDKSKYEITYLSYGKEPKPWYHVDHFYHKIPHDEVGKIYENADILIKTSLLESFSYPPLEMMATGGLVIAIPNDGNKEYLKNDYNCLLYQQGDIDDAVEKINKMLEDKKLREKLISGGLETAKSRSWENIEKDILNLYVLNNS